MRALTRRWTGRAGTMALATLAAVVLLQAGPPPTPAAAQEAGSPFTGTVPVPGRSALLQATAGASTAALTEALHAQACRPTSMWLRTTEGWRTRIEGAPAFVNARFPARVETAGPLFVHCASEYQVTVRANGHVLAGTLTLPPLPPPYPATILVSGSGAQDRDEAIEGLPGYRPFGWIAEHFQAEGIAVLRYDDRGVAGSTGEQAGSTSADFADDAEAVFEFLRTQPGIAPDRVGISGHSEGSLIAAMVAARNPAVAFVVSLAGPGIDGNALIDLQARLILDVMDVPPEVAEQELALSELARNLTLAEDWVALEQLIRDTATQQLAALPPEVRDTIDFEALIAEQMLHHRTWLLFFLRHDPAEDWARIDVPVLLLFGGLDLQVPAEENRAPLEAALAAAANQDVTTEVFPTANHLFQASVTGSPEEYPLLAMEFVPGLLDRMSSWIIARFGTAP